MNKFDVGYRKPPKKHQWKPGQSGNPSGKKKSKAHQQLPIMEALAAELCELHPVTIDGKKSLMSSATLLVKSTIRDALKAPLREKLQALRELERLGVLEAHRFKVTDEEDDDVPQFTEEDRAVLEIARGYLPENWDERRAWRPGRRGTASSLFEDDYLEEPDNPSNGSDDSGEEPNDGDYGEPGGDGKPEDGS